MKNIALALFLMGCGGSNETVGAVSFAVTLNAGQTPSCAGRMTLALRQAEKGGDVSAAGSWTCAGDLNYFGDVSGVWPAGDQPLSLTLATVPGLTTTAAVRFGWTGIAGTARVAGQDVSLVGVP